MTQTRGRKFQDPGHYTAADREKIDDSEFGDVENKKFPIVTQQDVTDAAHLIGKAAHPAAVKARIIAIAKKKGFSIPDAWKGDDARADAAEVTRVASDVESVGYATITRIDPDKREVTLTATSEAVDSFNTRFDYAASKEAFQRWAGNIREMHQAKAVGNRVGMLFDDARRAIDVTLRISKGAQDTWEKVLDGTLKGGSIGASNVVWEKPIARAAGEPSVPVARKYDLVEFSLVDAPSNPDCIISAVRSALPNEDLLDELPAERAKGRMNDTATLPAAIANAMANAYDEPTPTPAPRAISAPQEARSMGINDLTLERRAEQLVKQQRAARITAAGNAALKAANLAEYGPNSGTYSDYLAQVARVRGSAEAEATRTILAEERASAEAEVQRGKAGARPAAASGKGIIPAPDTAANPETVKGSDEDEDLDAQEETSRELPEPKEASTAAPEEPEKKKHAKRGAEPQFEVGMMYRNGQLVSADTVRGTPWQIDPAKESSANAPTIHGTQLVAGKMSESAVSTVQPSSVGHPIIYNSQDTEMLGFGVPNAATPAKPTPTDSLTLDPAAFHAGGHTPRVDNLDVTQKPGMADQDGDHDKAEDDREKMEGDTVLGGGVPPFTAVAPQGVPTPRSAAPELGEYANISQDLAAQLRLALPDATRSGARLSQESQQAVHGIRDANLQTALQAAQHCNCDECQTHAPVIIAILSGNPPDMSEDEDEDEDEGDDSDDMRAQLVDLETRVAKAMRTTSQVIAQQSQVLEQLVTRANTPSPSPDIAALLAPVLARLDDISLTVADSQRVATAQLSRALHDQQQTAEADRQVFAQHLEALSAVAASTQADVQRVLTTPVPGHAPIAPWAIAPSKTLGAARGMVADPMDTVHDIAAGLPQDQQVRLAESILSRQYGPK